MLFAITTVYRSQGDQLRWYGYAAFGLSVTPYAVMSFINLLGNLMTPEYPALFLMRSEVMNEAIRRGALIRGTVGELETVQTDTDSTDKTVQCLDGAIYVPACSKFKRIDDPKIVPAKINSINPGVYESRITRQPLAPFAGP